MDWRKIDWHVIMEIADSQKKRGRPSTNFDKKAYQRQYMADKRQAAKLGVSVREYREAVKNGR